MTSMSCLSLQYDYINELSKELTAANEEKRTKRAGSKKAGKKKSTAASHTEPLDDEDATM